MTCAEAIQFVTILIQKTQAQTINWQPARERYIYENENPCLAGSLQAPCDLDILNSFFCEINNGFVFLQQYTFVAPGSHPLPILQLSAKKSKYLPRIVIAFGDDDFIAQLKRLLSTIQANQEDIDSFVHSIIHP